MRRGQRAALIKRGGALVQGSIDGLMVFDKLGRVEVEAAEAGDVVAVVGLSDVDIGDTVADPDNPVALPRIEVEPDTFTVRIDGEVVEAAPATELPLAQRYHLF